MSYYESGYGQIAIPEDYDQMMIAFLFEIGAIGRQKRERRYVGSQTIEYTLPCMEVTKGSALVTYYHDIRRLVIDVEYNNHSMDVFEEQGEEGLESLIRFLNAMDWSEEGTGGCIMNTFEEEYASGVRDNPLFVFGDEWFQSFEEWVRSRPRSWPEWDYNLLEHRRVPEYNTQTEEETNENRPETADELGQAEEPVASEDNPVSPE